MLVAAELYEPNAELLTVAAFLLSVWYVVMVVFVIIRWPRSPRPGPPTNELRPEPPALANLLTHGWLLDEDAMPATLLDLSTRGFVVIEDRGDGLIQCRMKTRPPRERIEPYEDRILDHLQSLSSDGVVPAAALTTGPKQASKHWWRNFRKEVGAQAKEMGVARDFWPKKLSLLMLALAIPIFLIVESAQGFRDADEVHMTPLLTVVTIAMYVGLLPLGVLTATARLRETPAGRVAAAHWLGVREELKRMPTFPDLPPQAVATWERHLAYGAALGVAARAVKSLPLGAEHDGRAWTDYGGDWKQIRVRYRVFRPGWGLHPLIAVLLGIVRTTVLGALLWFLVSLGPPGLPSDSPGWVAPVVVLIVTVLVALLTWWAVGLGWALMDLLGTKTVTGEVLRTRVRGRGDDSPKRFYVAVYPGKGDLVRAWRVAPKKYAYFRQGEVTTVDVTPKLGYVRLPG